VRSKPDIALKPLSGISSDDARDARAKAWEYIFQCFQNSVHQKGGPATAPDDAKEIKNVRAESIIPE
jgi:hypothetical protein